MKKKGIIFALDGVIISTDHFHYLAWKAIADQEGIPFDEEINNRLRGVSRMASLEIILEKASKTYTRKRKRPFARKRTTSTANPSSPLSLLASTRKCWLL